MAALRQTRNTASSVYANIVNIANIADSCFYVQACKLLFGLEPGQGFEFLILAVEQTKDWLPLTHGCTEPRMF